MSQNADPKQLAREAKAIVALAFRNGPIEDLHAGKPCPMCAGQSGYSRVTNAEMKTIMKAAVDRLFSLLRWKADNPAEYQRQILFGEQYTIRWDDPKDLK